MIGRIFNSVPAQPPPCAGVVIPIPVIEQFGLIILVFGGEPERIGLGHWSGSADDFPEGAFKASPWVSPNTLNMR